MIIGLIGHGPGRLPSLAVQVIVFRRDVPGDRLRSACKGNPGIPDTPGNRDQEEQGSIRGVRAGEGRRRSRTQPMSRATVPKLDEMRERASQPG